MATTINDLITRAKSRIDMTRSQFVDDTEWQAFANDAYAKLYNLMVGAYAEYFTELSPPVVLDSQGTMDVPADFQKLLHVDLRDGSEWASIEPRPLAKRNSYRRLISAYLRIWPGIFYKLVNRKLRFFPEEKTKGLTARIWYVPLPARFTVFTNPIHAEMEQWSELIVLEMVIMAAAKEETDDSIWARERMILEGKVLDDAQLRSIEASEEVEDVRGFDDDIGYTRGRW